MTTKITDGSINMQPQASTTIGQGPKNDTTPVQTNSNDSKDQQEENHDPVPPTVEPMTTPLPTGDQNLSTSKDGLVFLLWKRLSTTIMHKNMNVGTRRRTT